MFYKMLIANMTQVFGYFEFKAMYTHHFPHELWKTIYTADEVMLKTKPFVNK